MRLTDKSRIAVIHLWRKLCLLPTSRKVSFAAAGLSLIAFGAAGVAPLAPDAADLPVVTITEELALPDLSTQISALRKTSTPFIVEERVRPGDNLWSLLNRMGVNDPGATNFIRKDAHARTLVSLRSGARLQASINQHHHHFRSRKASPNTVTNSNAVRLGSSSSCKDEQTNAPKSWVREAEHERNYF
jgi:hypothetical protein